MLIFVYFSAFVFIFMKKVHFNTIMHLLLSVSKTYRITRKSYFLSYL